jgi:phospholipid/cholesterol/gamma-HCH transport system ATP-binding protein
MITLEHVVKTFNDRIVLDDISAEFYPGKVSMTIGKSGSGKTVLLKSLVGLHDIDSGSIIFNGRDFTRIKRNEKKNIRKEIGMLFQGGALFDSLTIEENVRFPLDVYSEMTNKEKHKRANFCLQKVDLEKANKLFPSELSGGMQKRAAIARAIALNPRYLFCDEPNSGLDPQTALIIDKLIKEITIEFNITTIVNTHDMNSVFEMADQILFIHEGKAWWKGTHKELLKAKNNELEEFLYSSPLLRKMKAELKNEV